MAIVKDFRLDDAARRELAQVAARVPDAALVAYAHTSPSFADGGFRRDRPAGIRARIDHILAAAEEIDPPLRRLLARYSLNPAAVAPLSTSFLRDHREALAQLFGERQLRVAMLLDERETVRRQEAARPVPSVPADEAAASPPAADGGETTVGGARDSAAPAAPAVSAAGRADAGLDETTAWRRARVLASLHTALRELMTGLSAASGAATGGGTPAAPGAESERCRLLEQDLREARAEARSLKGIEARQKRAAARAAELEEDLQRAKAALAEAQAEARQMRQRIQQAEAGLRLSDDQIEQRARCLAEVRLATEFGGWLDGAHREVAEEAGRLAGLPELAVPAETEGTPEPARDPLLQRAAVALAEQARADRASGTRAILRTRLERIETLLVCATDALGNAMRPQTALQAAVEELRVESARLRGLLGLEQCSVAGAATLEAAINTSPGVLLESWQRVVGHLGATGVLGATERDRLIAALRRRHAMLKLAEEPSPVAKEDELGTPRGRLRAMLRGQQAGVLLLDAHNVLFSLQARYRHPRDLAYPDRHAREALVADLVRMADGRPTCRVRIIFDGPERSDRDAAANVAVVYSGGEGEHRADKVILDETQFFRQTALDAVLLATNDGALSGAAARLGVVTLAPTDLLPFLE